MNISIVDNSSAPSIVADDSGFHDNKEHSSTYYILSVTANCVVSALILVNNFLILLTLVKTKKLHTLPNAYIASLTVADFLLGILLVVRNFWLLPSTEWFFNEQKFVCLPFVCLLYVNALESIFCLVLVSFDRYVFIVHPYWYNRNVNARVVTLLILTSWFFSVAFGFLPLWLNDFTPTKGCNPIDIISSWYLIGQLVFFILSAVPIATMYGWIYHIMRRQRRKSLLAFRMIHAQSLHCNHNSNGPASTAITTSSTNSSTDINSRYDKKSRSPNPVRSRWRVIRFLIFVCAMFFVCWTPAAVTLPLEFLGVVDVPKIAITITISIAALNSACNMFAFIAMNADFRHALAKLIIPRKTPKVSREQQAVVTVGDRVGRGASGGERPGRGGDSDLSAPSGDKLECVGTYL